MNGVFVMDTVETSSERALAHEALAHHEQPREVLVGGLGLGFTLAELLQDPRVERVSVVERDSAVIGWMRDGTVPHGPALLADPRVQLYERDVADLVRESLAAFDLILLDVDNGPDNLVHLDNAALYQPALIAACRAALRPAGSLVVWSAAHCPVLHDTLTAEFGDAIATSYEVDLQGRAEHYWLHSARVASRS